MANLSRDFLSQFRQYKCGMFLEGLYISMYRLTLLSIEMVVASCLSLLQNLTAIRQAVRRGGTTVDWLNPSYARSWLCHSWRSTGIRNRLLYPAGTCPSSCWGLNHQFLHGPIHRAQPLKTLQGLEITQVYRSNVARFWP